MADETDDAAWPPQPSWGFACLAVAVIVAGVLVVWTVNYWQAFGSKR